MCVWCVFVVWCGGMCVAVLVAVVVVFVFVCLCVACGKVRCKCARLGAGTSKKNTIT